MEEEWLVVEQAEAGIVVRSIPAAEACKLGPYQVHILPTCQLSSKGMEGTVDTWLHCMLVRSMADFSLYL